MKIYEEPVLELLCFGKDDIIVTSGCNVSACTSEAEEDEF